MPSLHDPNFNKSITLICEHSDTEGAIGIVLNQPMNLEVGELLSQLDIANNKPALNHSPVYAGGPVQMDRGFILHEGAESWQNSIEVGADLYLTTSNDILHEIAQGYHPQNIRIALGYAGWAPGQLEAEIQSNAWLTVDYQSELVFNTPAHQQWLAAGDILGIDLNLLSTNAGHA